MAIEHKDITEANLHEPKGVSTASADQVYVANGAGTGNWDSINNAITVDYARSVIVGNTTSQSLTAATDSTLHTASDYADITPALLATDISRGITFNANKAFIIATAGIYMIEGWASISSTLTNNTVGLSFSVAGVANVVGSPVIKSKLKTAGDISTMSGFGIFSLPAGAVIAPVIADDGGATVTVHEGAFSIQFISKV